jgi:hypothetical protein
VSDEQAKAIDRLAAAIERQAQGIELLAQAVAMLLGEEMGQPVQDDSENPHRTMDGDGLTFRGQRGP